METADAGPVLAPVYTGATDWQSEGWRGTFYDPGLPKARMLEKYASIFDSIELDNLAYGVPAASVMEAWVRAVPDGFRFSAKVPRTITHDLRLIGNAADQAADLAWLLDEVFGPKLATLLVQMPPDFTADSERILMDFVDTVASLGEGYGGPEWGVELRSGTWRNTDIAAFLAERGFFCAITERLDIGAPLRYVRLLGTPGSLHEFDRRQIDRTNELDLWAKRIDAARRTCPDPIFVFVSNLYEGYTPETIARLRDRLGLPNITPPARQQLRLFG